MEAVLLKLHINMYARAEAQKLSRIRFYTLRVAFLSLYQHVGYRDLQPHTRDTAAVAATITAGTDIN